MNSNLTDYLNNKINLNLEFLQDQDKLLYTHLFSYNHEAEFESVFFVELAVRHLIYHKLIYIQTEYEQHENESDLDFEYRMAATEYQNINSIDQKLYDHFGIPLDSINSILFLHPLINFQKSFDTKIKTKGSVSNEINLDLSLPKDQLKELLDSHIKNYEYEMKHIIDVKNNIIKELYDVIISKIDKGKRGFKTKQRNLTNSLKVYDYVQARKRIIDALNKEIQATYESETFKVDNLNLDDSTDYIKLKVELKHSFKQDKIPYPSLNPEESNCFFKEEEFEHYGIKPGTAKNIYYYIQSIIEQP